MNIQQAIKAVTERTDLSREEMRSVMEQIMTGEATPAQIGGFLIALRMKGETIDEITAAAEVMRSLAARVEVDASNLVDIVGTGGDGRNTFNISTASALVVAAAGGRVAKHGNRAASSSSGSADLLEEAGVRIDLNPRQVADCIGEVGLGFMFAPAHHSAMKYAIGPRKEMAVRTIFNVLGPLTNPAGAPNAVIGVFDRNLVEPLANVLARLGSRHVLVVHSEDGLDEISISAPTHVAEMHGGEVRCYEITPEQFGVENGRLEDLAVDSVSSSLGKINDALDNKPGAARDVVALNSGAAIYVSGLADSLDAGVARAREVLASGAAKGKLAELAAFTNRDRGSS
jgi:anthranilate phosphoribosyltransferase